MQCVHREYTQYSLFQTLKMLPHPLYLAQFGVIHHKVITSITEYITQRMVTMRIQVCLNMNLFKCVCFSF